MQKFVKYNGVDILIGADQFKYYSTFYQLYNAYKNDQLSRGRGGITPAYFLRPGIQNYFRFSFPDERHVMLGEYFGIDPKRTLRITMDRGELWPEEGFLDCDYRTPKEIANHPNPNAEGETVTLELWSMCLWNHKQVVHLSPVFRDSLIGLHFWPIDEQWAIDFIVTQIEKHHVLADTEEGPLFWKEVAKVIKDGFVLDFDWTVTNI